MERLASRFLPKIWGSEVWLDGSPALPVLVKFISTFDKLSVQVHPGDDYARRCHNCVGKTEMWHILAARQGAQIAAGLRRPVSKQRLRESATSGEIVELLEWHDAAPGDTFFIPAGTIHAIGDGVVLCEIQQHSNITYRLYDWNRRPPLHFEHAMEVSRREPHAARREFVECEYFTVRKHEVKDSAQLGPAHIYVIIEGNGKIEGDSVRGGEVWYAGSETAPIWAAGNFTALTISVK